MPVQVQGIVELRTALKKLAPDLERNMQREIRAAMQPVVKEAKTLVPTEIVGLRKGWIDQSKARKITAGTSQFARRKFPKFNASNVRAGIVFSTKPTKRNFKGFVTVYSIKNLDPAGAIYETAGRKTGHAQEWVGPKGSTNHKFSHSPNPDAGQHFINAMGRIGMANAKENMRGRLIYKAWHDNQGRALAKANRAIDETARTFKIRLDANRAFRDIAA
jgi:hypothetical protein